MHHQFLGFMIEEWGALIVISGSFLSAFGWVLNKTLLPLKYAIEDLTRTMEEIREDNERRDMEAKRLEGKFNQHLIEAGQMRVRISNLEKEIFQDGKGGKKQ